MSELEVGRQNSYLEQQTNTCPRQARVDRICINGHIAHDFEAIQPANYLVGLLFQNKFPSNQCKPPPVLNAEPLLLQSGIQGLLEYQVNVTGIRKDMTLNSCPITIRESLERIV
jgi:hypothetical protein